MVFSSSVFLFVFLPIVLIVYSIVPGKLQNIWLLLSSLFFYLWGGTQFFPIIIFSILINYLGGMCLANVQNLRTRKFVLVAFVGLNILNLGYWKYTNFLVDIIRQITSFEIEMEAIILPIGISFYTFQGVSYIIDVYRKEVEVQKNPIYVALYICLFPQLIAGPIVRYSDIAGEIKNRKRTLDNYEQGIIRFIMGLSKKAIIANSMGAIAEPIFKAPPTENTAAIAWIGAIAYSLQIYFDFSGYSDMAIGIGRIFGFTFPENFNYPYISKSITEFWRRWHISLSSWFRDYIYIPLGGNRCGKSRQYLNILITFSVSGLWHGANWTFLFWGFLHGVYQIIEKELTPWIRKINEKLHTKTESFGYKFTKVMITFVLVDFAWIFFRAESMKQALHYIERMIKYRDWWSLFDQSIYQMGLDVTEIHILALGLLLVLAVELMQYFKRKTFAEFMAEQWMVFRWISLIAILVVCIVFGYYGPGFNSAQFIYFQF